MKYNGPGPDGKPGFPGDHGRHEKSEKLPPHIQEILNSQGLKTEDVIFTARGDMTDDGEYCTSYVFFDGKGLYIACFDEKLSIPDRGFKFRKKAALNIGFGPEPDMMFSPKKSKKHPEHVASLISLVTYPLDDIDQLETEIYSSTARLIAVKDGDQTGISRFTLGSLSRFANLVRAYNTYKETGKAEMPSEDEPEDNRCLKCGKPCPPGKSYCPKHDKNFGTAVRLFKFFGGHIPQILMITFFMLLSGAISVLIPQISTRALYDDILANPDGKTQIELVKAIGTLVLSLFGIRLFNTVITVIQDYASATITPKVMYDIKVKIFEAMQKLSVGFYSSKQTGSLMNRVVRDSTEIYWFFTEMIPQLVIKGTTLVGVLAIMFFMEWKLSLITVVVAPILMIVLVKGEKLFRRLHHSRWVFDSKVDSMISDNINGQKIIKAFAKEDDEYQKFSQASNRLKDAQMKVDYTSATLIPLMEILVGLLSTVILGLGATFVVKGEMTPGELLSFIVYLEMLREPLGFISPLVNEWSRTLDASSRVFEICDARPDITERPFAKDLSDIRGDVDIRELEFEYEPARPVIRKLNLHVNAGEMLGIVGKTGAGKTTIANLIARLYDAKEGSVRIDGIDVRNLKLSELRKNIGLVSQDIYLFIGSIADNIRYAKPDASMDEVIAAAKAASAHDFIMKLPDAYETRVGAGGQNLSGGERQRISIARTIIQNPKILILDEATAAMDTETERNIQASLTRLKAGRTTIAIAHRLSTLRDSDNLAVIEDGTIVEFGTYSELMKNKGEFYRQYKIQSEALKTIGIGDDDAGAGTDDEEEENGR